MGSLILGGRGQLARALIRALPGSVWRGHDELDITDHRAVTRLIEAERPDTVFNCAAYNLVDRAESDSERCFAVNAIAPGHIARTCAGHGVRFVHFSTNFVFDGSAAEPYTEDDQPAPRGVYATSKRQGELEVLSQDPSSLLVRTSAVYGVGGSAAKGGSLPERVVARAGAGSPIRMVSDQLVNPTFVDDLATATAELAFRPLSGVVHLVSAGCCSWYEFASETLKLMGLAAEIAPVATTEGTGHAPRPRNGCLRSIRVPSLRGWRAGLADFCRDYRQQPSPPRPAWDGDTG